MNNIVLTEDTYKMLLTHIERVCTSGSKESLSILCSFFDIKKRLINILSFLESDNLSFALVIEYNQTQALSYPTDKKCTINIGQRQDMTTQITLRRKLLYDISQEKFLNAVNLADDKEIFVVYLGTP